MKNYNQPNYDTVSQTSFLNRSKSQNHYYIQANEFQRRYRNSIMSAYREQRNRKWSPCCSTEERRKSSRNMAFDEDEKSNQDQYDHKFGEYYQTSHFAQNSDQQTVVHLRKSKNFLVQKSNLNCKIQKELNQNQIKTLSKLLHTKEYQIQELNKQIMRLKKISLEILPNNNSIPYIKQDHSYFVEIHNKDQLIKELERKINQFRQENSYFRQDIEIKNKEIEQQRSKFKMKQDNDTIIKKQLGKQNADLKQQMKSLNEKIDWFEKYKEQKQVQWIKDKQNVKKLKTELLLLRKRSDEKDMQIQDLLQKINSIQSELDFFKNKFTNLLFEIEKQERQSGKIYDHAVSLKQQGLRFCDTTSMIKQSQANWFDLVQNRLAQSIPMTKVALVRDTTIYSPSHKNINKYDDYSNFFQSRHETIHKYSSLHMGLSSVKMKE